MKACSGILRTGFYNLNGMQTLKAGTIYSGISGLQLPIPKFLFPPPYENKSRLTYYSSFFNSIEFNSSFYKIPQVNTVEKWEASVSDNFKFTFKLWKGITHNRGLTFNKEDIAIFFKSINSVQDKKGCLLIQLPPALDIASLDQLVQLLNCIKETDTTGDWKIAVEFRNKSWYHESVYNLLNIHGAAIVIQDLPKSLTPTIIHKSDFLYFRFHGPTGNYRESYSETFLNEYANQLVQWNKKGKSLFVYFNNTMGDAFNNLTSLNSMIRDKKV